MSKPDDELRKSISCFECVNALVYCLGPRHQFANYWREGEFDSCRHRGRELKFCLEMKNASSLDLRRMARELLQAGESTTEGSVWDPRTEPPKTRP